MKGMFIFLVIVFVAWIISSGSRKGKSSGSAGTGGGTTTRASGTGSGGGTTTVQNGTRSAGGSGTDQNGKGNVVSLKSEYMRAMDREGIKYREVDDVCVQVNYSAKNTNTVEIKVIFSKEGAGVVALRCWSFGNVKEEKRTAVMEVCNRLNKKYRWVKFYLDNDSDVTVAADAVIDKDTVGPVCIQLARRMTDIYDECYPILMKEIWS